MTQSNANGEVTFSLGNIIIPNGDWDYRVGTITEVCTLNVLDAGKPEGGLCTVCKQPMKLQVPSEHALCLKHQVQVRIADHFPTDKRGNKAMQRVWDCAIRKGNAILFHHKMQVVNVLTPERSLLLTIFLQWDQPLRQQVRP